MIVMEPGSRSLANNNNNNNNNNNYNNNNTIIITIYVSLSEIRLIVSLSRRNLFNFVHENGF